MNNASKPKYKLSKKTKARMAKVGTLSALAVTSVAVGTILSSCSGVAWKSTAQLMVSDDGSTLADQSFSESAYNGIKTFYEDYCQITGVPAANSSEVIEGNGLWKRPGNGDEARIRSYENIKNDGSNIVVATGFTQDRALQKISSIDPARKDLKETFKDTGFIFVDGAMQKEYKIIKMDKEGKPELDKDGNPIVLETIKSDPTNIASISYRADEGSFLVGVSTAVYLNKNWQLFVEKGAPRPESIGVSGFVGQPLPSTVSFLNGFRQGLMYWNSISSLIQVDDSNPDVKAIQMKWVSPISGNMNINSFSTEDFSNQNKKVGPLSNSLINNGAKVILPIAGPQTKLVVNSVVQSKKNVSVIGVDIPQETVTDLQEKLPGDPTKNVITFSSIKDIQLSVKEVLNAVKTNQPSNGYKGFGYNNIANLTNKGVGISPAGYPYLIDPLFFASNPEGQQTGAVTPQQDAAKATDTYDLSTKLGSSTKWSLNKIVTADKNFDAVYGNYKKLLNSDAAANNTQGENSQANKNKTTLIKYDANTTVNYRITGDELSNDKAKYYPANWSTLLPPFTGAGTTYDIAISFGGTATTKVATGTLLDGTKWHYGLEKI